MKATPGRFYPPMINQKNMYYPADKFDDAVSVAEEALGEIESAQDVIIAVRHHDSTNGGWEARIEYTNG